MSSFTTPLRLVPTLVAPGTILPIEAIQHATFVPSRFLSPDLNLEDLVLRYTDGRNWILLEEFDFASAALERLIHIPVGFTTDFASTPRILWPIFPPTGTYGKAALGHDFLYRTAECQCSRLQADQTFLEMMTVLHVQRLIRTIMFLGVRVGGSSSFRRRT